MKLAIAITTYNRPKPLLAQLKSLYKQLERSGHSATVLVVNDGSLHNYSPVKDFLKANDHIAAFQYDRFIMNMGKQRHWQVVNMIFRWYRKQSFDRVLYLQDDLILPDNFLSNVIQHFEAIPHADKVCLNFVLEESRNGVACWTPAPARKIDYNGYEYYRVGWVELHFIANHEFFKALEWKVDRIDDKRWDLNPDLSSGVGRQISKRLFRKSKAMFQVRSSLAGHGEYRSVMSPEKAKDGRLRSI